MRIVHFSDLHSTRFPRDARALFDKRALGVLNYLLRRRATFSPRLSSAAVSVIQGLQPDILLCTGDLTSVGAPAEFADSARLIQAMVCATGAEFWAVPGNHDRYVRDERCWQACRETLRELNAFLPLEDMPAELSRHGLRLFFLDEALPTAAHKSSGQLGELASAWLDERTRAPRRATERRILVGHFPSADATGRPLARRRALQGGAQIARLLEEGGLDASLCGHIHTPFRRDFSSGAMEVCAGALPLAGLLNVLDYSPDSGVLTQHWEHVGGASGCHVGLASRMVVPDPVPQGGL